MKHALVINVVTYVPTGSDRTVLETKDKLIKSISSLLSQGDFYLQIIVNNMPKDEFIFKECEKNLQRYIQHSGVNNSNIYIHYTTENNLTKARNFLVRNTPYLTSKPTYITFSDDDDKFMPTAQTALYAFMKQTEETREFDNKLNFFCFKWERTDGDFIMPKDIKSKPLNMLGRSTFTFSNWGWVARTSYLLANNILWPEFVESPKLDDNYFHVRSALVNRDANFILTPLYCWNNRDNQSSVSNRGLEPVDEMMEYFKMGNVGYNMTPYLIRDRKYIKVDNLEEFSYNLGVKNMLVKGMGMTEVFYDEMEMCYRTRVNDQILRNIISVADFMKNNSTFQLRMLAQVEVSDFFGAYMNATLNSTRSRNGKPNYESKASKFIIAELS